MRIECPCHFHQSFCQLYVTIVLILPCIAVVSLRLPCTWKCTIFKGGGNVAFLGPVTSVTSCGRYFACCFGNV